MAQVELSPQAGRDLARLREWLAERNAAAAERSAAVIIAAIDRLAAFPEIGPRLDGSRSRELKVDFGRYGYRVRYRYADDTVTISRIFHSREGR